MKVYAVKSRIDDMYEWNYHQVFDTKEKAANYLVKNKYLADSRDEWELETWEVQ